MKKSITLRLFLLLALSACVPTQYNITQTPTAIRPMDTATKGFSANPENTATSISVLDFVSRPDYKNDCQHTPPTTVSQAGYLGIYPGLTSANDVKGVLGEPTNIFGADPNANWVYDNFPVDLVSIVFVNNTVETIDIVNIDLSGTTLKEIVEVHGCPSLITLTDRSEHASGNYDAITFSYLESGIDFWFDSTEVMLRSVPNETRYFKPISLAEYISLTEGFLYVDSLMSKPVYWHDVVIDQ